MWEAKAGLRLTNFRHEQMEICNNVRFERIHRIYYPKIVNGGQLVFQAGCPILR
jgi:hypothetical protein